MNDDDTFARRAARRMDDNCKTLLIALLLKFNKNELTLSHAELLAAYHHDLGPIEKTGPGEETRLTVLRKDAK
ncbi:MAG TPA: hypothetical protein VMX74_09555 [Pirellulales bacterium]|nr:hypothetical protein [Pirellulales bacterium]